MGLWLPPGTGRAQAPAVTFALQANAPFIGNNTIPNDLKVADVNGDGKPDALLVNYNGTMAVLLGNGSGGFVLQANPPATGGSNPSSVAVADVNGDGRPDALVTNYNDSTLGVLLGNGSGGFVLQASRPSIGPNSLPYRVGVADVNGDGKPDVLAATLNSNVLAVLLGNGSGSFVLQANPTSIGASGLPYGLAVADVNGDGKPDALTANANTNTLGVLLGNGSAGFVLQASPPATGGAFPLNLAVADVSGDGKPDALVTNYNGGNPGTLGVLLGTGTGSFVLQASPPATGGRNPQSVAVADVNGDGRPDALVANADTGTLGVLLGTGSGGFVLQANPPATGSGTGPVGVVAADVNGDGRPDVLTANHTSNTLGVLLNTTPLVATASLPGTGLAAGLRVYPNPAGQAGFTVAVPGGSGAAAVLAELLDVRGRLVQRHRAALRAPGSACTLPAASLPAGLYLLRLTTLDAQGTALEVLPTQRLAVE